MSVIEFGHFVLTIALLLVAVHGLGYMAERLKQPRIVGEILAGILLGPFVLKLLAPTAHARLFSFSPSAGTVMGFLYQLGLILLMFCSGAETRRLLAKENRRNTFLLLTVSDLASFALVLGLGFGHLLPLHLLTGPAGQPMSTLLIVAIGTAVCSIPVISRIFWDLRIMKTRFVSLILGYALLEDLALWTVLAFATALAKSATLSAQHVSGAVMSHIVTTLVYTLIALLIAPALVKWISNVEWNVLYKASPVGYVMAVLMGYCAIAAIFDVNLQFAALLAGYGVVGGLYGTQRERFALPLDAISKVSFGVFVPIYFGLIGYKLVFGREFSFAILLIFLIGSSLISVLSAGLAARLGGFRGLDIINIALTTNARGGPGIVLASVAYDAGIINAAFYTTLVITAVITSQMAGAWLRFVLSKGWPLLSTNPDETWGQGETAYTPSAVLPETRDAAA
ncbi:MAG TPA: cation:proton antiporter [Candidatus Sulfotelmatobacter sp.]|jgi:Kef-type K+ transport system membrane component KefB